MRCLLAVLLASSLAGCAIDRATSMPVRRELATDCSNHCAALGMRLTAVVIVANAGGCVCEPTAPQQPAPSAAPRAGAAAAASGAVLVLAQQQQRQRQTGSIPSTGR